MAISTRPIPEKLLSYLEAYQSMADAIITETLAAQRKIHAHLNDWHTYTPEKQEEVAAQCAALFQQTQDAFIGAAHDISACIA